MTNILNDLLTIIIRREREKRKCAHIIDINND